MKKELISVFLNESGRTQLCYLSPDFMQQGSIDCLSVETNAPYLEVRVSDPEELGQVLLFLIPHHFVELIVEGESAKRIGFHR